MKNTLALPLLFLFSLPALAQRSRLESFTIERDGLALACTEIEGASGRVFIVVGSMTPPGQFELSQRFLVGVGALDAQGNGRLRVPYPRQIFGPDTTVELCAAHREGPGTSGPWVLSDTSTLRLTGGGSDCEELDVDHRPGLSEMQKGEVVTDQFAVIGLTVSASNNRAIHPDKAIIFDPAGDTTNADPDLHTDLGKVLIVAENDVDANADGFIDVPDDEAFGGDLVFDFADAVNLETVTAVDIDDANPSRVHLLHSGGGTTTVDLLNLGDGTVQELQLAIFALDVVRMTVELGGSGGIAGMNFSPCPRRLDFDEDSAGVPLLARKAGEEITDQFACMGVTISGQNGASAHPDKAILFDSSNPTGGDDDLATPGPGIGNDEALGLLLIVAENDVDGDADGLIDDPDDERFGGNLVFDFDQDMRWFGATVVDIDDGGPSFFDLFDSGGGLLSHIPLPNLGNDSAQTIDLATPVSGVRKAVLHLGGSGGLAEMLFCPVSQTGE